MRAPIIAIFASALMAGTALAQVEKEVIDNRPAGSENDAVMDSAPTSTPRTPEERARDYSTSDNEAVITEAQPGEVDGVPGGQAPVRPNTAGENAVIDETPGTGMADKQGAVVVPRNDTAVGTHSEGENAVIDEKPGVQ